MSSVSERCRFCDKELTGEGEAAIGAHPRCLAQSGTPSSIIDAMVQCVEAASVPKASDAPLVEASARRIRFVVERASATSQRLAAKVILRELQNNLNGVLEDGQANALSVLGSSLRQNLLGEPRGFTLLPAKDDKERYAWRDTARSAVMSLLQTPDA